jgi:hypothetical protein
MANIMSKIPDFEIVDGENFKVIYATGAFGGLAPNDGRIVLYIDLMKTKPVRGQPGKEELDKIVRERQIEIHMSPATWKSLARWMAGHVDQLEKAFGKIPETPKDIITKKQSSEQHIV